MINIEKQNKITSLIMLVILLTSQSLYPAMMIENEPNSQNMENGSMGEWISVNEAIELDEETIKKLMQDELKNPVKELIVIDDDAIEGSPISVIDLGDIIPDTQDKTDDTKVKDLISKYMDEEGALDAAGLAAELDSLNDAELTAAVFEKLAPSGLISLTDPSFTITKIETDLYENIKSVVGAMQNAELLIEVKNILSKKTDEVTTNIVKIVEEQLNELGVDPAKSLIKKYMDDDGVIDTAGLAAELDSLNDAELTAAVFEQLAPSLLFSFTGPSLMIVKEDTDLYENIKNVVGAMQNEELLTEVKDILSEKTDEVSSNIADIIEKQLETLELKPAKDLIDKYTDEAGALDTAGLAEELVSQNDEDLTVMVLDNLSAPDSETVTILITLIETGMTSGEASEIYSLIKDANALNNEAAQQLIDICNAPGTDTEVIATIFQYCKNEEVINAVAIIIIDAYTGSNGTIDTLGLAQLMDNMGDNAQGVAAVLKNLPTKTETVKGSQSYGTSRNSGTNPSQKAIKFYAAAEVINGMENTELLNDVRAILAEDLANTAAQTKAVKSPSYGTSKNTGINPTPTPIPVPVTEVELIGLIDAKGTSVDLDVPFYKQGKNRCGPTSLAMALAYYGHNVDPDKIMGEVGDGVYPNDIVKAARAEGFQADYFSGDGDLEKVFELLDKGVPLIFNVEVDGVNHFLVVTGYNKKTGQIFVNDPNKGADSYSFSEFSDIWGKMNFRMIAIAPEGSAKAQAIQDILY